MSGVYISEEITPDYLFSLHFVRLDIQSIALKADCQTPAAIYFNTQTLDLVLTSDTAVILEDSDLLFQMCRCCNAEPLELEWHLSHLVKQTKQTEGSRVQINHFRHARMQPRGNFSESLNANILHYSWGSSVLLPNQTAALN